MSPRTRKALPTIEPIVPVTGTPLLQDPQWIYEPKFDGFRGVLYVTGRECYIWSKRNKVLSRFADLALRVGAELHARDAILDGEVVALDDEGRMDFRALLAGKGWLHYAAFDVLWLNGKDLQPQQLIKRKRRLEQLIPANNPTLSRVVAVEEHGRELYEAAQRLDLEGIVASGARTRTRRRPCGTRSRIPPIPKPRAGGTRSISRVDPSRTLSCQAVYLSVIHFCRPSTKAHPAKAGPLSNYRVPSSYSGRAHAPLAHYARRSLCPCKPLPPRR